MPFRRSIRNAPGYEWSTWGIWDADNKPRGASVSYFIQPVKKDTAQKSMKADSVQVKIYNDKQELVRNLRWKADSGFNRRSWGMEGKGYRNPRFAQTQARCPRTRRFARFARHL